MRPLGTDGKPAEKTRAQSLKGQVLQLPPAPPHLVDWLQELGVYCPGPDPLPATEIAAWAQATGRHLARWEFVALQEASRAFVTEYHAGHPHPPDQPHRPPDQQALSKQLKGLVGALNRRKPDQ